MLVPVYKVVNQYLSLALFHPYEPVWDSVGFADSCPFHHHCHSDAYFSSNERGSVGKCIPSRRGSFGLIFRFQLNHEYERNEKLDSEQAWEFPTYCFIKEALASCCKTKSLQQNSGETENSSFHGLTSWDTDQGPKKNQTRQVTVYFRCSGTSAIWSPNCCMLPWASMKAPCMAPATWTKAPLNRVWRNNCGCGPSGTIKSKSRFSARHMIWPMLQIAWGAGDKSFKAWPWSKPGIKAKVSKHQENPSMHGDFLAPSPWKVLNLLQKIMMHAWCMLKWSCVNPILSLTQVMLLACTKWGLRFLCVKHFHQ